jgi:protein disulfide-isomerase-like protein
MCKHPPLIDVIQIIVLLYYCRWINKKVGTNRKVKTAPSDVAVLTTDNFDEKVLGSKAALVEFYAPWCGHCKSLAPIYEKVANVFAGDDVVIGKVDATEENDLAEKYGISGFPTIKYFPAGATEPMDYPSGRDVESFVMFMNENAGTKRKSDGSLTGDAGRIPELDALINAATAIDEAFVTNLNAAVDSMSGAAKEYGATYSKFASKIIAKGTEYVEKEVKRLEGLAKSAAITAEKKTGIQLRQNILSAFLKSEEL